MSTGIYLKGGGDITINDFKSKGCSTAVHAIDINKLKVNGLNTKECDKSLQLDNCWDADIKDLNIGTKKNVFYFRESILSYTIRFFMNSCKI